MTANGDSLTYRSLLESSTFGPAIVLASKADCDIGLDFESPISNSATLTPLQARTMALALQLAAMEAEGMAAGIEFEQLTQRFQAMQHECYDEAEKECREMEAEPYDA